METFLDRLAAPLVALLLGPALILLSVLALNRLDEWRGECASRRRRPAPRERG